MQRGDARVHARGAARVTCVRARVSRVTHVRAGAGVA